MKPNTLYLFNFFHLNLMYSSIEEEQRLEVINRCYWPLLQLAKTLEIPIGIEASGITLEIIQVLSPDWITELKNLIKQGLCEFIGCGYAQLIGPLVPAEVNAVNLSLGHQIYEELLGQKPKLALVNEQAYSAGLIQHYLDAGYRAIIMEWNNPYRYHPEWHPEWRYLPQFAWGQQGESIPLIWNKSIAFQKFQRYAHNEMEITEYLEYLCDHITDAPRTFPLYGNDVEVFDFRPGRYHTESVLELGEWQRIETLFSILKSDRRFDWILPSQVLEFISASGAGNYLRLESPEHPIPVKKQGKYNLTRWAVTGRDDLGINTSCWQFYNALKKNDIKTNDLWKELCYLWSSDFRTHITLKRWNRYQERMGSFEDKIQQRIKSISFFPSFFQKQESEIKLPSDIYTEHQGRYLILATESVKIALNCRRGLAIDKLWFNSVSENWLCGTLHHGYYDDIQWGADYYTGHLVFESPGQPKVTDLNRVEPQLSYDSEYDIALVSGKIQTPLGIVHKYIGISRDTPKIYLGYQLEWSQQPIGVLRLGHITSNPEAFDYDTLFFRTHNGGYLPETFMIKEREIDHSKAVSFLVSAESGLGITDNSLELGDSCQVLKINIIKEQAALLGMMKVNQVDSKYFFRLILSAREIDETCREDPLRSSNSHSYLISISARSMPIN